MFINFNVSKSFSKIHGISLQIFMPSNSLILNNKRFLSIQALTFLSGKEFVSSKNSKALENVLNDEMIKFHGIPACIKYID